MPNLGRDTTGVYQLYIMVLVWFISSYNYSPVYSTKCSNMMRYIIMLELSYVIHELVYFARNSDVDQNIFLFFFFF